MVACLPEKQEARKVCAADIPLLVPATAVPARRDKIPEILVALPDDE